jgi:hypothetical protein
VKRYLVLAGDNYYPSGWEDFKGCTDSLEEARKMGGWSDWCEIVDTETEEVVERLRDGKKAVQ